MDDFKLWVQDLGTALDPLAGIPFKKAIKGKHAENRLTTLLAKMIRIKEFPQGAPPAFFDAISGLYVDTKVVVNLVKLLVAQQQWELEAQSASLSPRMQELLHMFKVGGSALLTHIINTAAEIEYPQTANSVMSAIQYQDKTQPGKQSYCEQHLKLRPRDARPTSHVYIHLPYPTASMPIIS
jgi:hypothetical protein